VPAEHVAVRDPEERLFQHGQFFEGLFPADAASPTDLAQWRAFQARVDALASWRDDRGRRAFASPLARSSTDPRLTALDRQSMESWLDLKGFTSPRVRWAVEYACRDDYGATLSTTSAWAALFYFASRRRAAGARERPVLTWPAGNAPLLARLSTGVVPVCGRAVADLELVRGGVVVRGLDASGRAFGVRAQHVVVAAPRFVAARLLAHEREQPPAYLERCTTSPWLVVNLHLSQHPRSWGFPRAWDNVLHESPSLGYVTATHQSGRDRGPTVLTWYQPFVDADTRQARARLLATTREDAVRLALDDLAVCHRDLADVVTRADACRFGHGMVRPVPGLIHSNARLQAAAPVVVESMPRVFFAHTDLSGLALFEEAFFHGVRAAEELLRARNVTSEALL
jgi:hypothetical protein